MPEQVTADCPDKNCVECSLRRLVDRQADLLKKQDEKIKNMEPIVEASLRAFAEQDGTEDFGKRVHRGCVDLAAAVKRYRSLI